MFKIKSFNFNKSPKLILTILDKEIVFKSATALTIHSFFLNSAPLFINTIDLVRFRSLGLGSSWHRLLVFSTAATMLCNGIWYELHLIEAE